MLTDIEDALVISQEAPIFNESAVEEFTYTDGNYHLFETPYTPVADS